MPGSTPATSQLDWLSSTTAMIELSWSKAARDLLKSFCWGIGALRQLFASDDGAISSPPAPYHLAVQRRAALRAVGEQHPQRHTGEPRLRRRRRTPPPDRRDRTRLDNRPEATIRLTADRPRSDQ